MDGEIFAGRGSLDLAGETPDPLTLPECDLRKFPWMQLDVVRLRDSEVASLDNAEAFRCAVLLWCAAWHQIPAASLPDDETQLARLAGYGRDLKTFRQARGAGGMHGWIKCSDGRFYHPIVAEKANEVWAANKAQLARTEAARLAKQAKRADQATSPVTTTATDNATGSVADSVTEPVTRSKEEERRRKKKRREKKEGKQAATPRRA